MALELATTTITAQSIKELVYTTTLSATQQLKAEVGPEEELDETVPEGKSWAVSIAIKIIETDA